jgi:hypothetical protein
MRHLSPTLDMLKGALRVKVCANCPHRPPGSECLGSDVARGCEAHCPVFVHLPQIKAIGEQVDTMIASRERVLRGVMNRIREIHDRGVPPRLDETAERTVLRGAQANRVARVVDRLMGC